MSLQTWRRCALKSVLLALSVTLLPVAWAATLGGDPDPAAFRDRRQRLAALAKEGVVVVATVPHNQPRLTEYFIEHSDNHDFIYLTGLDLNIRAAEATQPEEAFLVLLPQSDQYPEILFVPPAQLQRAQAQTGIKTVLSLEKLNDILSEALTDFSLKRVTERRHKPVSTEMARVLGLTPKKIFYFNYPRYLNLREEAPAQLKLASRLKEFSSDAEIRDASPLLTRLRARHDAAELEVIRKAVDIGSQGLVAAMKACRPGATDNQVAVTAEFVFKSEGAERLAYPAIIYIAPFTRKLQPLSPEELNRSSEPTSPIHQMQLGDLVMLDAGAEYRHYATDLSRTVPVSGKFNDEQRMLYVAVLAARHAAVAAIHPGATIQEVHQAAVRALAESRLDRYFTFGTSHFIAMDAHDPGNYEEPLGAGMILVVEPGIMRSERNITIHVEDMILVTESGHEVLSKSIPIEIDDIENLVAGAKR
jgi:Xaa-Pro aminopeptidase